VNAGISKFAPLEAVDEELFDTLVNINLRGAFFTAQHMIPLMPDGSSIIFTGSTAAHLSTPPLIVYAATKAAVRSLCRTLARELAPRKIRVNTLTPGLTDTPVIDKAAGSPEAKADFVANSVRIIPLERLGEPDEMAKAALFLAADATYTTGAELTASGGLVDL
jgi:NAD(P)-dependent dehydrogenase (short-subunit alcohol dehydrogenase family)